MKAKEPPCPEGSGAEGYCGEKDDEWITGQRFERHPTSTAVIGDEGDAIAVLYGRFRVRGVRGLRVVDASVFPAVATFMVSKKGNDVLKDAGRGLCSA